jgi:hypothetical protein
MSNSEDIEARLCAYIEGELDGPARAEIERHLRANPAHQKLIDDLIRTRAMVRSLPRAQAPADVAEQFLGQLERTELLGSENDDVATVVGRINRWAQIRAIAAVLLLTGALAGLIYLALPPGANRDPKAVVLGSEPGPMVDGSAAPSPESSRDTFAEMPARSRVAAPPGDAGGPVGLSVPSEPAPKMADAELARESAATGEAPPTPQPALAAVPPPRLDVQNPETASAGAASPARPDKPFAETPDDTPQVATDPFAAGQPAWPAPVLVVEAKTPQDAAREVEAYLSRNQLRWHDVAGVPPTPMSHSQVGGTLFSRALNPAVQVALRAAEGQTTQGGVAATPSTSPPGAIQAQKAPAEVASGIARSRGFDASAEAEQQVLLARDMTASQVLELNALLNEDATAKQRRARVLNLPESSSSGHSGLQTEAAKERLPQPQPERVSRGLPGWLIPRPVQVEPADSDRLRVKNSGLPDVLIIVRRQDSERRSPTTEPAGPATAPAMLTPASQPANSAAR